MTENDPSFDPPPEDAITPPSSDLQHVADNSVTPAPEWQPQLDVTERSVALKPRWPHPNFGWSFLWCLLFLIVTQVPGAVVFCAVVFGFAFLKPNVFQPDASLTPAAIIKSEAMNVALGAMIVTIGLLDLVFSWLILRLIVGRDWKRQLALRWPSFPHTLLALAAFPAMVLLGNIVYDVLRSVLHVPSLSDYGLGMEQVVRIGSQWPWGFAVFAIGLGPGIGEELWFRGYLGRGLIGNYGAVLGIVATSFFFGLFHIDPCQGTAALVMGLWLHFVYVTTRSLLLPMLLHTLNNSLGVLITRAPQLQAIEVQPRDVPWIVYASSLLLLVGVAYALYQSRARLVGRSPEQILAWRPAFEGVEYPPANSGMRVEHPAPSLAAAALALGGFLLFVFAFGAWVTQGLPAGG